ncbi:oxidation resistance protein 1 [Olea europaea var. sylvestris]|uniref:oxidation resistance protein 1 n=1 Tax=Olea europaea var. sylvestris TaxID=158386 RepID=UPI000C1D1B47|nr:oxidation resistance protein 1 [Olea europaea var. sylvestris]
MGREHQEKQEEKQRKNSLRSKAAHFLSDLTTVYLNPISEKPSKSPPPLEEKNEGSQLESDLKDSSGDSVDGPDTSSFTAFLYSLVASSESQTNSKCDGENMSLEDQFKPSSEPTTKENGRKKSLFSRGKQSLGKAFYQAAKLSGFRNQGPKGSSVMVTDDGSNFKASQDEDTQMNTSKDTLALENLPETSQPSLLLSEKTRSVLHAALPVTIQGLKWVLLYSTWRHGISLSTLYRRSMIWPGLSLLVVGDRNGTVFGGLVEAPLRPSNKKYQGTNDTFVFTNISGHPRIFRPTGMNRYFTLCSTDYLALGGGGHFALYLDGDLLSGSSSSSETYGNPCLANAEDFVVKETELWGFVYASKYDEVMSSLQTEVPGISRLVSI